MVQSFPGRFTADESCAFFVSRLRRDGSPPVVACIAMAVGRSPATRVVATSTTEIATELGTCEQAPIACWRHAILVSREKTSQPGGKKSLGHRKRRPPSPGSGHEEITRPRKGKWPNSAGCPGMPGSRDTLSRSAVKRAAPPLSGRSEPYEVLRRTGRRASTLGPPKGADAPEVSFRPLFREAVHLLRRRSDPGSARLDRSGVEHQRNDPGGSPALMEQASEFAHQSSGQARQLATAFGVTVT